MMGGIEETCYGILGLPEGASREEVEAAFGRIDVLFNHAGSIVIKPFLETTEEEWDRLTAINVKSMFLMTKAVLPVMIGGGGGSSIG